MAKKALCVGINDYPYDGSDLNGCVNDARSWARLLQEKFDFAGPDITVITDRQATKATMVAELKKLLAGAKAGDVLVFTNSSHGTYVADKDGDEELYDEALCPYDVDKGVLLDDELRQLFANLASGVHLTVISDSCHSGTVTRAPLSENIPGLRTPDDRRVRFLHPSLRGGSILPNVWKAKPRHERYPEASMRAVLLSGCTDKEYSYDARINGEYHGVMSFFAKQAITEMNFRITYAQLASRLSQLVEDSGYPQHPQLEGRTENKRRQVFS
jgi:hypothetical protein